MMSLFLYRFPFTLLFLFRCRFRFRFRYRVPIPVPIPDSGFLLFQMPLSLQQRTLQFTYILTNISGFARLFVVYFRAVLQKIQIFFPEF